MTLYRINGLAGTWVMTDQPAYCTVGGGQAPLREVVNPDGATLENTATGARVTVSLAVDAPTPVA